MIDKLNDKAIKKYQRTHDPYKQLQELVEKNGTKLTGGNGAEPMSTTERDLLETYEEMFGHKNDIILKSGMYPNDDDKLNDKYEKYCECANKNKSYNVITLSNKVHDKYLDNLKTGCVGSVSVCTLSCAATQFAGNIAASSSAHGVLASMCPTSLDILTKSLAGVNLFSQSAIKTATATVTLSGFTGSNIESIAIVASHAFASYIIPIIVPIIIAFVLIILYMWLYRRRKRSWKHECKNHLCK